MRIEPQLVGNVMIVSIFVQRLDSSVVADFVRTATEICRGAHRLVLDLSKVAFIDSSALGALVGLRKGLGPDAQIAVSGAQSTVATLFQLTRLDRVFRLFPTAISAAAALEAT